MDIKHAFRNVPIHSEDRPLLGMAWKGEIFIDKVLPFGLRSAPLIFATLADALTWMMQRKGIEWLEHYLHNNTRSRRLTTTMRSNDTLVDTPFQLISGFFHVNKVLSVVQGCVGGGGGTNRLAK